MGKKTKIGRQRRDRFYHLAKETGYRSRAAFKLIQLNRKFEFLQKARVLVDLCAAPGGWMQVAKQNMPVSSVVVGIDMWPMKPVPGCITLTEDITTDKCRVALQKELKTWKADVILNDGAPNIGKNWLHDAYNQNCLTLSALKLATQFLREGGWFVTKVFRSKDYNCLMWVFKQMFRKVHATKPAASRNESAEIFVVCQHYLAPAKIDPRFLNPNYVFKDLEVEAPVTVQTLLKSVDKDKKKAVGYSDDMSLNANKLPASTFMNSDNPAMVLQNAYEIVLDDEQIEKHPKTTEEIKLCCKDIKVLGKKELRSLIAWWKAFRDDQREKNEEEKAKAAAETGTKSENDELSDEEKELDEVSKQIDELVDEERREAKRKRKKENREKTKLQVRMNLNMRQKDDLGPTDTGDKDVFKLTQIQTKAEMKRLHEQRPDTLAESDDEEGVPKKKPKKVKYNVNDTYLDDSGMYYKSNSSASEEDEDELDSDEEGLGLRKPKTKKVRFSVSEPEVRVFDAAKEDEEADEDSHPLITDLDFRDARDKRVSKAQLWFDKDAFKDLEDEADEDFELDTMSANLKEKGAQIIGLESEPIQQKTEKVANKTKKAEVKKTKTAEVDSADADQGINEWDVGGLGSSASEKRRKKKDKRTLDVEGLAVGTLMVNSLKAKRDIIDAGWNRYAFNDENLPDWFVEDEKKHMRKEILVPSDLVEECTKSRQELNARPIKKIAEAKARKKKRATRRLEKLKKKLEGVMENPDMTEPEKARQAKQMYRRLKQPKPEVKYIVAKKHTAAKRVKRPKGLKGPYKVVDPRLKKDLRANKKKEANTKRGKKSFKGSRKRK